MRTIKIGNTGAEVVELQKRLGIRADGQFGPLTVRSVIAYQLAHGLQADGVVGPKTWEHLTADDSKDDLEFETSSPPAIIDGWYEGARKAPAHPGRIGARIEAEAVVVHTTDMMPSTFDALCRAWQLGKGKGSAAHWILGRTPAQGLVQLVSTEFNANHAGGSATVAGKRVSAHGWFRRANGKLVHPNSITLGIEVHAAGRLGKRTPEGYLQRETRRVIPDDEVFVDAKGIGWHEITAYQFEQLELLLSAIAPTLKPMPTGTTIVSHGTPKETRTEWATVEDARLVGHVTLDPIRKTDPGPQLMDWIHTTGPLQ